MADKTKATEPEFQLSDRGFAHWTPVKDTYGHKVEVYESSAAERPCMWLSIRGSVHLNAPAEPTVGIAHGVSPDGNVAAHLTFEQALAVVGRIKAWIERHQREIAEMRADAYAADLAAELGIPWAPGGPRDASTG